MTGVESRDRGAKRMTKVKVYRAGGPGALCAVSTEHTACVDSAQSEKDFCFLFTVSEWQLDFLPRRGHGPSRNRANFYFYFLTVLRAGPPFSWGVTSGGPPGGRSLSKDGTRADSAKDFCRLVCGVIRRKSD